MSSWHKTHFVVPRWWVAAYDFAGSNRSRDVLPDELAIEQRIIPALSTVELSSLAFLISALQAQVLSGQPWLRIDTKAHQKYMSAGRYAEQFAFQRITQLVSALSVFPHRKEQRTEEPQGLFTDQKINVDGPRIDLSLKVDLLGQELLLGYGDPYLELKRKLDAEVSFSSLSGGKPPLILGKAVWLDLTGLEQLVLLRIEGLSQWDFRLLSIENVFGHHLYSLFENIVFAKRSTRRSRMGHILQFLGRMGQKLQAHGVLVDQSTSDYLAFSDGPTSMQLLWNRGAQFSGSESAAFKGAVFRLFNSRLFGNHQHYLSVFLNRLSSQSRNQVSEVVGKLKQLVGDDEPIQFLDGNLPLLPSTLFVEWFVRQLPENSGVLPEKLKNSHVFWLTSPLNGADLSERYNEFSSIMQESQGLKEELEKSDGWTLVSAASLSNKTLMDHLKSSTKMKPIEVDKPAAKEVQAPQKIVPRSVARDKKTVAESITRLKEKDPSRYGDLKKAYIDSLDNSKKQVVLEVQRRLNPGVFDEHLRHSLIKYVVDNPDLMDVQEAVIN